MSIGHCRTLQLRQYAGDIKHVLPIRGVSGTAEGTDAVVVHTFGGNSSVNKGRGQRSEEPALSGHEPMLSIGCLKGSSQSLIDAGVHSRANLGAHGIGAYVEF